MQKISGSITHAYYMRHIPPRIQSSLDLFFVNIYLHKSSNNQNILYVYFLFVDLLQWLDSILDLFDNIILFTNIDYQN